ncbi:hypothetical protein K4L05_05675 [Phaeobacter inhibens]|uniref:hypothetical protein n=1 Tax=Phaeobacter inhibens TaxID=221822 RepID=UPI0012EBA138|nr:hypothetical protein [Phaeobacter inhibens]UWR85563.1 hypothetical protein K4L05_05675 [Phaeobacter inhibens]
MGLARPFIKPIWGIVCTYASQNTTAVLHQQLRRLASWSQIFLKRMLTRDRFGAVLLWN